jgi:hypothetical protein
MTPKDRNRARYLKRTKRVTTDGKAHVKEQATRVLALSPRLLFDLERLRMKRDADRQRVEVEQRRRAHRMTSLPLLPSP